MVHAIAFVTSVRSILPSDDLRPCQIHQLGSYLHRHNKKWKPPSSSAHMTTAKTSSSSARPLAGVWQRLWEEDPIGDTDGADRDTLVLWTQAPESGIYVDIRLPLESPGRSLEAAQKAGFQPRPFGLAARGMTIKELLSEEVVSVLLLQKSFAGVLQYSVGDTTTSGEALAKDSILAQLAASASSCEGKGALALCTCFWRRDIDYQPPSGGLDVGVCASEPPNAADGSIDLRETGDDASYAEGWRRLPGTNNNDGPFLALQLESENGRPRTGFWVQTGSKFAYAVGRPTPDDVKECVGKSLAEAAESLVPDSQAERLLLVGTYVAVAGEIDSNGKWCILHSTNPELVGCELVGRGTNNPLCCSTLEQIAGFNEELQAGSVLEQVLLGTTTTDGGGDAICRRWKVSEVDGIVNLLCLP